jgi:acyl-CoA hydrolase
MSTTSTLNQPSISDRIKECLINLQATENSFTTTHTTIYLEDAKNFTAEVVRFKEWSDSTHDILGPKEIQVDVGLRYIQRHIDAIDAILSGQGALHDDKDEGEQEDGSDKMYIEGLISSIREGIGNLEQL